MNIVLWIAQVILAGFFITVGSMKAVISKKRLATAMDWVKDYPESKLKWQEYAYSPFCGHWSYRRTIEW